MDLLKFVCCVYDNPKAFIEVNNETIPRVDKENRKIYINEDILNELKYSMGISKTLKLTRYKTCGITYREDTIYS